MAMLAYEEAASQYERALRALSLQASLDEWQAGELLLALGEAPQSGAVTQAQEVFWRAAELARQAARGRCRTPPLLARAAVGFGGDWSEVWHLRPPPGCAGVRVGRPGSQ